jgi:signal transduction histidine kinase
MSQIEKEKLLDALTGVAIFKHLNKEMFLQLAEVCTYVSYNSQEAIIRKGDEGNSLFIIMNGEVRVHDGEHELATLKQGDYFGEFSIIDNEPRSTSVSAIGKVELIQIERNHFYHVLNRFPEITKDLMAALSKRMRSQNQSLINYLRNREKELQILVDKRTEELHQKNYELAKALKDLELSMEKLVRQEKLASLGQLTAGIAHELQNPLNFVTNFAQLSIGLIEDLKNETDPELKEDIMADVVANIEKINQHGTRASRIIRRMVDHSRVSKGEYELTNLNSLCKEYVFLAFAGVKSNIHGFDCNVIEEYDEKVPQIKTIPQDVARALLNIVNNAFYALNEKRLMEEVSKDYKPELKVSTKLENDHIIIRIKDNATGIKEDIRDKIFNPFFTTKPPGDGTGLGLSISHDIVRNLNGELTLQTQVGVGTEFIISFPIQ